jgi:hypothetical protein
MPPAFALSQDQTLRFISNPTKPSPHQENPAQQNLQQTKPQAHRRQVPQETQHKLLEASVNAITSLNAIKIRQPTPQADRSTQDLTIPRSTNHQSPNLPLTGQGSAIGRRQRIPSNPYANVKEQNSKPKPRRRRAACKPYPLSRAEDLSQSNTAVQGTSASVSQVLPPRTQPVKPIPHPRTANRKSKTPQQSQHTNPQNTTQHPQPNTGK